jgi:RNA polymerase primary sigma factor
MTERLLTAADELRLARRSERGDTAAKEEMVVRNLGLVHALALRHRGRGVAMEDLVQEGTVGLIRAVERFDHRRGLKFSTYAVWWIRRSLLDAIADTRTIRIPVAAQRQIASIQRAQAELRRIHPHAPDRDAIARRTGLTSHKVEALQAAPQVTASLDEPVGEDLAPLVELIPDTTRAVEAQVEDREARSRLWSMLGLLPERHRQVLVRRYGLLGDRAQSHEKIGAFLGVGEERSRQIERQALHRLREIAGLPRAA